MRESIRIIMISAMLLSGIIFAREKADVQANTDANIVFNGHEYVITETDNQGSSTESREEIILWEENFENGENGWSLDAGWEITSSSYHSESHSALSADSDANMNATHNLLTPTIELPDIGDGETMNFGFWLYDNQPDSDSDGDDYLDDYYAISILDLAALAWHSSDYNANEGENFWCADEEEVGGYLDSWIQYLDTPSISIGDGGSFSANIFYAIEDPAGAVVGGTCTDGWDSANIRISSDGGNTWELLEDSMNPYDFECGYGWIWNDTEYDTNGSLNHLAAGWGGMSDDGHGGGWKSFSADLSSYAGQDVIIRFAFGSDPAWCTLDESGITGFQVDDLSISDDSGVLYSNAGDDESTVEISGEVWVDQFYDYGSCADERPGCDDWEEYVPGIAFNGNVFMDISDFAGKSVVFRIQSRYDGDNDLNGQGDGLHIDDFKIYKISGGNYPAPMGLTAEPGDGSVELSWYDMNASGTDDFIFDNDNVSNSIQMSTEGSTAWAGERIDLAGPSTVNSLSIYNVNSAGTAVQIGGFGALGSLINNNPTYSEEFILSSTGWNTVSVNWSFNNGYIIGHQFSYDILVGLDESAVPSTNSMVLFAGGGWDSWSVAGASVGDGEWGIRANISYEGAGVTYKVYRDGALIVSALTDNGYIDDGLENNVTYEYAVSATYSDGEESEESDAVTVTPFANTVHEEGYDDGSFESSFNAGSGNFSAVRFSAGSSGEDIVRFKWFQIGSGGAFYIKVFEDDGGMPGAETYSAVQASGNLDGWNEKDLSAQGLVVSGDFWIGTKEFSSTNPFGLDTDSNSGDSYQMVGSTGDWTQVIGNLAYHVYLDCGENCDGNSCTNDSGDVNEDGTINVLDIVQITNHILGSNVLIDCSLEAADMNGDNVINVLDIVQIVNIILGSRGIDATSAKLEKTDDALLIYADGYIGGIQMTLTHGSNFSIKLTNDALVAKSYTEGNKTTLVVVVPEVEEIFTFTGDFEITDMIIANSSSEIPVSIMPSAFTLSAAYPNPFNPSTSITLHLPMEGNVNVKVYDLSGRAVTTLLSGVHPQGDYTLTWNASEAASGMYMVRANIEDQMVVQKILLLK